MMKADTKPEFYDVISPNEDEFAKIDALLFAASNEATSRVDFDSIKKRIIKNSKKRRHRRVFSYVAAAACMLLCFGMVGVALANHRSNNIDVDAQRPTREPNNKVTDNPNANPDFHFLETKIPNEYTQLVSVGALTKGGSSDALKTNKLFPDELPKYMVRRVDANSSDGNMCSIAEGTDDKGSIKYFDCSVVNNAPHDLNIGQVGSFVDGAKCMFYWQISENCCLRVRFYGFENDEASKLFMDMTDDILAGRIYEKNKN